MEMRPLGRSGLQVSRLALGTMTWGRDTDEHEARDQLLAFVEAGGTLVDTADVYADGRSEQIVGSLVDELGRDSVVLATKAVSRPGTDRRRDASRGHLLGALDASLRRLGVDHVDLWQLHAWDPLTPVEETLGALDTAVSSGKARYVGISNYSGWQTATVTAHQAARHAVARPVSTQMEYSLLQRGIEREVVGAAEAGGLGILPWSPLAAGFLSGKYRKGQAPPDGTRFSGAAWKARYAGFDNERSWRILAAVDAVAKETSSTPASVSLAWLLRKPAVTSVIIGARTVGLSVAAGSAP